MEHPQTWKIFPLREQTLVLQSRVGFPDMTELKFGTPGNGGTKASQQMAFGNLLHNRKSLSSNLTIKNY